MALDCTPPDRPAGPLPVPSRHGAPGDPSPLPPVGVDGKDTREGPATGPTEGFPGEAAEDRVPLLELSPDELQRKALHAFRLGNQARLTLVQLLLALDESRGFLELGYSSVAAWAKDHLGWRRSTTFDALRTARALADLPRLRGAFLAGHLCWSALAEITRVATPATEEAWLRFARGKDAGAVRDEVRRAVREGRDRPPEGRWGLPNLDRKIVLKLTASQVEKVRRAFAGLAKELSERSGRSVGLAEVLLYLAELELAKPAEERVPEGAPPARYAVVYTRCPACGRAAMQTDRGLLEVSPEEVDRVEGEADVVHLDGAKGGDAGEAKERRSGDPDSRGVNFPAAAGAGSEKAKERRSGDPDSREGGRHAVRRKIFLRDGEACASPHCDRRAEQWHHVQPRSKGGPDTLDNGVALCARCHAMAHAGLLEIRRARDGRFLFTPRGRQLADELQRLDARAGKDAPRLVAVRTSGRRPFPPGGPPADSRLPSPEEIAASLAKTFGFRKAEALERVHRALESLGPERSRDLSAIVQAALRG